MLWASARLKDDETAFHGEFKRIISEVHHEDHRGNEVAYGWLALTTLYNPSLGSIDEAKVYYDKCLLKANICRDDIFWRTQNDTLPDILQVVHGRFQQHPQGALHLHIDLHDIIHGMRDSTTRERFQKEMKNN